MQFRFEIVCCRWKAVTVRAHFRLRARFRPVSPTMEKEEMIEDLTKRRWLDKVKNDIKEKGRLMKCTTVLHRGECHRTWTPHKTGSKMKKMKMELGRGSTRKKGRQRKWCMDNIWHDMNN